MSLSHTGLRARSVACAAHALFVLVGAEAHAQSSSNKPAETIVVTGTRTPQRVDETLAEVTVIGRPEIEAAAGRTLAELLAQQPGVQSTASGGLGKLSSVFIRGLEPRHTLLLIDGVRYGSATAGQPIWDNIPLDLIERIEIARGPLSALYGSDAAAGVVQIFTRGGTSGLRPSAVATAGSENYGQIGGGVSFGSGVIDGAVFVQALRNRGFSTTNDRASFGFNPDTDGFEQKSGSAQLGINLPSQWRAAARALQSKGTTHIDDGLGADSRSGVLTRVLSLQAEGPITESWRTSVRIARSNDESDTQATAPGSFTDLGVIGTVQRQFTVENTVATGIGTVLLLAERLEQNVSKPAQPFTVSERTINAIGLGLNGAAGIHHWQTAVRHDRNSQFGTQNTGSVAYGADLTPELRLAASLGTSFVAPSFNLLYFPGFSNPKLLPEEGIHRELSVRWTQDGHQVRGAYFQNRIRGFITSGPQPTNIPYAESDGFSLAYDAALADWTLGASIDLLDPQNASRGTANFGKQLPRRAKDMLRLSADRRFGSWSVGGSLQNVGARFDNAANTTPLPEYTTADLRVEWKFAPDWRVDLKLNNIANVHYETAFGFNQPGREVYLTLRYGGF